MTYIDEYNLDEINTRNAKLYEQAKIALRDMPKPIYEIPRHNEAPKSVFAGKDKNGMAIFNINWW